MTNVNPTIDRLPVTSSNIKTAGWKPKAAAKAEPDAETPGTLEVEFLNGGIYRYYDVQFNVWQKLDAARNALATAGPTFGQLFDALIKKQGYRFEKVS